MKISAHSARKDLHLQSLHIHIGRHCTLKVRRQLFRPSIGRLTRAGRRWRRCCERRFCLHFSRHLPACPQYVMGLPVLLFLPYLPRSRPPAVLPKGFPCRWRGSRHCQGLLWYFDGPFYRAYRVEQHLENNFCWLKWEIFWWTDIVAAQSDNWSSNYNGNKLTTSLGFQGACQPCKFRSGHCQARLVNMRTWR